MESSSDPGAIYLSHLDTTPGKNSLMSLDSVWHHHLKLEAFMGRRAGYLLLVGNAVVFC